MYSVSINQSNPNLAVTGGGDDKAVLFDVTSGSKLFELTGHTDSIVDTAFNATGTLVATAGLEGTVKVPE